MQVDGANRHGVFLNIVQVLSDLNLIISKSYISSDGGWFMDVFHVTDYLGHKLRNPNLIHYIQQSLNIAQRENGSSGPTQVKISHGKIVNVGHFASDCTALEITSIDRQGIFSEVTTMLFQLSYAIDSGELWTHNGCIACILYIKEQDTGRPISHPARLASLGEHIASVVEAHHFDGELWEVRLRNSRACRIHTERRLHQLMQEYKDYEAGPLPLPVEDDLATILEAKIKSGTCAGESSKVVCQPQVSIESWKEKDYLVVNIKSQDRPKLMFDTVCALTDLDYDIFNGSVSSHRSVAFQEYFVRQANGCTVLNEMEKQSVVRSLAAAVDRRMTQGIKKKVRTLDRHGLLSNVSRVLKENSLPLEKAKFGKDDILAVGTFYITDASLSANTDNIDQQRLEAVHNEINKGVYVEKKNVCSTKSLARGRWSLFSAFSSLGKSLWSHIKRFFSNFNFIR